MTDQTVKEEVGRGAPRSSPENADSSQVQSNESRQRVTIRRHSVPTRLLHWFNFLVMLVMLGSGLQIFNAHPALYWGKTSHFSKPVLALEARQNAQGQWRGITQLGGLTFNTTGVLGLSKGSDGQPTERGFPAWATIPSDRWLAAGRLWHFFFAWIFVLNGLAYLTYAVLSGHLRRDLLPTGPDLRHLGREIFSHVHLRFPKGAAARQYNGLQKLAYLFVLLVLGPLVVATGLTMSPTMDANWPWLLDVFGGRQSARTIHFICACSFVGFFIVHIAMVLLSGAWNNIRSMITGCYVIELTTSAGTPEARHET